MFRVGQCTKYARSNGMDIRSTIHTMRATLRPVTLTHMIMIPPIRAPIAPGVITRKIIIIIIITTIIIIIIITTITNKCSLLLLAVIINVYKLITKIKN